MPNCKVCANESIFFGEVDFNKSGNDYFIGRRTFPESNELVTYYRCIGCGYIFTNYFDDWESKDYKEKIYNAEYIKADPPFESERPQKLFKIIESLLGEKFKKETILDYGGGEGELVALLQMAGYIQCENFDPFHSENKPNRAKYGVITCFEVIEHVPNQIKFWESIFSFLRENGIILFSTLIQPEDIHEQGVDWWYICPRNGHVGFHTIESLKISIGKHSFNYDFLNEELHLAKTVESKVLEISKNNFPSIFSEREAEND